jgi:hypothetical protein
MNDQEETFSKKPDFDVYNVLPSRDGKGYWNRIGAAWKHNDGYGCKVRLDCLPRNGELDLRVSRNERMQEYEDQRRNNQDSEKPNMKQNLQPER